MEVFGFVIHGNRHGMNGTHIDRLPKLGVCANVRSEQVFLYALCQCRAGAVVTAGNLIVNDQQLRTDNIAVEVGVAA